MSQTNIELVREGVRAWNEGNIDWWLTRAVPDFEWSPANVASLERSVYRGHGEVRRMFGVLSDTWSVFRLHDESEVRDLGASVLWLGRVHAIGRASGLELDQEFAARVLLRDGLAMRVEGFLSWREGLDAAGLSE